MAVKKKGVRKGVMRQADREKTDVRLSPELMRTMEQTCLKLGVTKNAFFVMGTAYLCAQLTPILAPDTTSGEALAFLNGEFGKVMQQTQVNG